MHKNTRRGLRFSNHRNELAICIAITLTIGIYLTINSVKQLDNEVNKDLINPPSYIYLCPQLSSSSKGYFRVEFTKNFSLNYSLICKSNDILLIYILSTAKNFQRRQYIRQTWANKAYSEQLNQICFIFIVGLPENANSTHNNNIRDEAAIYGDIVQLNIIETYQNIIYKEVGALKWSYLYASKIPFLFKTDDDLIIDTLLLSDVVKFFIHNRTDHSLYIQQNRDMLEFVKQMHLVDKYTIFKGTFLGGLDTFRSGKFGIHELAWNHNRLPPYCSGFGFIFSSFIRDRLYRASLCYATEYVPLVGDVFVSGFLAGAASVRCSGWSMINRQTGEDCGLLFRRHSRLLVCSTKLHMGRQGYSDFEAVWQAILSRHPTTINKTSTSKPTTTTTVIIMNNTALSNSTNITVVESIKNLTKNEEIFKLNEDGKIQPVLFVNSSNETVPIETEP